MLKALFVTCHNLSITLKCFALFSLHCTVLTITSWHSVSPAPLLSWHHFTSISYNLLACYCQILVCLLSLERESSREEYPALPCGLIPEVVFNTIIEIINLYSSFYFCFVYFVFVYFELEFPKRTAYEKSVIIHL